MFENQKKHSISKFIRPYIYKLNNTMKQILLYSIAILISFKSFGYQNGIDAISNDVVFHSIEEETIIQNQVSKGVENPLQFVVKEGRLQIRLPEELHTGSVFLFDLLGNKIFETLANDNIDWSLANLKSGIYFVVWKENKSSFTRKFIHKQDN